MLVPRADPEAMAEALFRYVTDRSECRRQGREARAVVERDFSMDAMVDSYMRLYDTLLKKGD